MRILVVGATGLIGRPVATQLLSDGFDVRLLVRDADRARTRLGEGFEYVEGDVGDQTSVERAVRGCRTVHVSLAGTGPEGLYRVEGQGTGHIAEAAADSGVRLVDRPFMAGRLRANLELMALLQRLGARGDPAEANRLLSAPTTTVRRWCEVQAASRAAG